MVLSAVDSPPLSDAYYLAGRFWGDTPFLGGNRTAGSSGSTFIAKATGGNIDWAIDTPSVVAVSALGADHAAVRVLTFHGSGTESIDFGFGPISGRIGVTAISSTGTQLWSVTGSDTGSHQIGLAIAAFTPRTLVVGQHSHAFFLGDSGTLPNSGQLDGFMMQLN